MYMVLNDVRQIEMHTDEPSVPECSSFEGETVIEKLCKSPDTDQILVKVIHAGSNTSHSEKRKTSVTVPIYKSIGKFVSSNM